MSREKKVGIRTGLIYTFVFSFSLLFMFVLSSSALDPEYCIDSENYGFFCEVITDDIFVIHDDGDKVLIKIEALPGKMDDLITAISSIKRALSDKHNYHTIYKPYKCKVHLSFNSYQSAANLLSHLHKMEI